MNEVNSLGVKQIEDLELIRKILHSLRRPDYDLVTTILYEKDLNTMTQNQVLNKMIAHKLCNDIKVKTPSSSPTHSALACKQLKKLKKMAIKGSLSDEEEEDTRNSSNDEKEPMNPNLYKQVKKMNKYLKKINSMGVYGLPQRWTSSSTHEGWEEVQEEQGKEGEEAQAWIICHISWIGKWWWRIKRKFKWWIKQEIHHTHGIIIQHLFHG